MAVGRQRSAAFFVCGRTSSRRRSHVCERKHGRDPAKRLHCAGDRGPTFALHLMREEQRSLDSGAAWKRVPSLRLSGFASGLTHDLRFFAVLTTPSHRRHGRGDAEHRVAVGHPCKRQLAKNRWLKGAVAEWAIEAPRKTTRVSSCPTDAWLGPRLRLLRNRRVPRSRKGTSKWSRGDDGVESSAPRPVERNGGRHRAEHNGDRVFRRAADAMWRQMS